MIGLIVLFVVVFLLLRAYRRENGAKETLNQRFPNFRTFHKMRETERPLPRGKRTVAADGHEIPAEADISCARFGHHHAPVDDPEFSQAQFIVHEEPVEGYINLNGKLLRRAEADEYMRKHG